MSLHLVVAIFLALAASVSAASAFDYNTTAAIRLPTAEDAGLVGVCSGLTLLPRSCPVTCFRTDPVCGENGVTYWCGCADAMCAGIGVAKLGFCEVGNDGAGPQALLLVHIVWLIVVGFSVLFGVF